jgi:hypothetical protein
MGRTPAKASQRSRAERIRFSPRRLPLGYHSGVGRGCGVGLGLPLGTQYRPAGVQVAATPHDHFTASPDCGVRESTRGRSLRSGRRRSGIDER